MHWRIQLLIFFVALLVNSAVVFKLGISNPVQSDAMYFKELAIRLAEGDGYCLREHTYWPNEPTMRRMPGWPYAVSIPLKSLSCASADVVMRVLNILFNSLSAVILSLIAWRLWGNVKMSMLAGLLFAMHPVALHLAGTGMSEPLFILLVCSGVFLVLADYNWQKTAGVSLLGLACLVRANFVLLLPGVIMTGLFYCVRHRPRWGRNNALWAMLAVLIFLAPPLLWAVRNYRVCGKFPVLSTLRGQTFYGGNNDIVAHLGEYWGLWIFPDAISGEVPMRELAANGSELDVDAYYYGRGKTYVSEHITKMPGLLLGKLVRAYIPVAWKLSLGGLGVSVYRVVIYILASIGVYRMWSTVLVSYKVLFWGMLFANIIMVLTFWGCARFAFVMEPFLLPFAACGAVWIRGQRGEEDSGRLSVSCRLMRRVLNRR